MDMDLARLPLAEPPSTRVPLPGAPLSIPTGVPSGGAVLRFWIKCKIPNSVPVSGGGNPVHQAELPCLVRLSFTSEVAWYPRERR